MRAALFTILHTSSLVSALPWYGDCPENKAFYTCAANGFSGCCSVDACDLAIGCPDPAQQSTYSTIKPVITSDTPVTSSISTTACKNTGISQPQQTCPPGSKIFRQFNPFMMTIDNADADPGTLQLANYTSNNTHILQVMIFNGVPNTAANFHMGWAISSNQTYFHTHGSGSTASIWLLDNSKLDFSKQPLTADEVNSAIDTTSLPNVNNGVIGQAGFGFWDDYKSYPPPKDHNIYTGPLPLKTSLAFKLDLVDQSDVVLKQGSKDGIYLQYDC